MTMGRKKNVSHLMSKAGAASVFGLKWYQVDYLIRSFHVEGVPVTDGDRRSKVLYRYADLKRIMKATPLKRAS